MAQKEINLDDLLTSDKTAVIRGKKVRVLDMDGASYAAMRTMTMAANNAAVDADGTLAYVNGLYEIATRCLPDLKPDEVTALTFKQVGAVIALAMAKIEDVEEGVKALMAADVGNGLTPERIATTP